MTALNLATGVPVWEIEPALGLIVGGLLAAGIYPVIRQIGSRAEQGGSLFTVPGRGLGDSFQVGSPMPILNCPFAKLTAWMRALMDACGTDLRILCVSKHYARL